MKNLIKIVSVVLCSLSFVGCGTFKEFTKEGVKNATYDREQPHKVVSGTECIKDESGFSNETKGTFWGALTTAATNLAMKNSQHRKLVTTLTGLTTVIGGNRIGAEMDEGEDELRELYTNKGICVKQTTYEGKAALSVSFDSDMLFDVNTSTLKSGSLKGIEALAVLANNYPAATFTIEGYTDSSGSKKFNQTLSEERALAIETGLRDYLKTNKNQFKGKIQSKGYGETYADQTRANPEDRRADVFIEL